MNPAGRPEPLRLAALGALFAVTSAAVYASGDRLLLVDVVLAYYAVYLAGAALMYVTGARIGAVMALGGVAGQVVLSRPNLALGEGHAWISLAALAVVSAATFYALPRWLTSAREQRLAAEQLRERTVRLEAEASARAAAEEALRESQAQYAQLVREAPVGIVATDVAGNITKINPAALSILGSPGEVQSAALNVLTVPAMVQHGLSELFRETIARRAPQRMELAYTSHWGKQVDLSVEVVPLTDVAGDVTGSLWLFENVTDRIRAQETLRESEERWRAVAESALDAVVGMNGAGIITEWNPRAEEMFGWQRQEIIGRALADTIIPARYRADHWRGLERFMQTGAGPVVGRRMELEGLHRDGRVFPVELSVAAHETAGATHFSAFVRDITERRQNEEALRDSERKLRTLVENVPVVLFGVDKAGMITVSEGAGLAATGRRPGEAVGRHVSEVHGQNPIVLQHVEKALAGEESSLVTELNGLSWESRFVPVRDATGDVTGVIGLAMDVSERVRSQRAIAESERRLRTVVQSAPVLLFAVGRDERFTFVDGAALATIGQSIEGIVGSSLDEMAQAVDVDLGVLAPVRRALAGEEVTGTGTFRGITFQTRYVPTRDDEGEVTGVIGVAMDVSERVRAETALRESEERYRTIVENATDFIYAHDLQGNMLDLNDAGLRMIGMEREELRGRSVLDLMHPEEAAATRAAIAAGLEKLDLSQPFEFRIRTRTGGTIWMETRERFMIEDGRIVAIQGIARDITQRREAERAVRESEARYRRLIETANEGIWTLDAEWHTTYVNRRLAQMLDTTPEEMAGRSFATYLETAASGEIVRQLERSMDGTGEQVDIHFHTAMGRDLWTVAVASRIDSGDGGVLLLLTDVTERKRLEQQYLQAQKMESMGRLAGGVAHDFSNLMTAIMVNAELDLDSPPPPDVLREDLQEIYDTAQRAAHLSQQLLAFSRRQMIEPRVLVLNDAVLTVERVLRRLIDESIELEIIPSPDGGAVKIDPHQLEQVLINLVVNARDAMTGGGRITIEAGRRRLDGAAGNGAPTAPPGDYMRLAVTDTGCGMTPDVRERIFEPFFTTKGVGKGTGLGLATVYGAIKQAGGHISVTSEPGSGAKFEIYLPAHAAEPDEESAFAPPPAGGRGSETILLVEDEPAVRRLTARVLRERGYTVIEAANGAEALGICRAYADRIDLMLTDVVMPGMSGQDLAARVGEAQPSVRVLYMSGYTDNDVVRTAMEEGTIEFLQKPFSPGVLAARVRAALERNAQPATNS